MEYLVLGGIIGLGIILLIVLPSVLGRMNEPKEEEPPLGEDMVNIDALLKKWGVKDE